jgi:hypothetical protein
MSCQYCYCTVLPPVQKIRRRFFVLEEKLPVNHSTKLFRNRVFQAIIISGLFLQIGIWVRNFAVLLFIMEKTKGDPFAVSLISVAEFAPIFIFSFIGGTFADRWRPKPWCGVIF